MSLKLDWLPNDPRVKAEARHELEELRKSLWYMEHEDLPAAGWFQACVLERRIRILKARLAELELLVK